MIDFGHVKQMRDRLIRERGGLTLLALFEREDRRRIWDLIVAGGGLRDDSYDDYHVVGRAMQETFDPDEMMEVAKIVLLPADYDPVVELVNRVQVNGEPVEVRNFEFFQFDIRRALIFHAEPVEVGAARA
ncbi:MAG TPA: hypothetical protein VEK57_13720 [Thermoanaerobaculia bacterium]|nr:hypothetical protein [Thermoanaerobaculia bacterium]